MIGTSGSGKTTMAARLAARLKVPHIEMDALHWEPNWTEAPLELFRERVSLKIADERWVADGNYGKVRDLVWARADAVIWLDYELGTILWQLWCRTILRLLSQEPLWSGNRERWRTQFFTRDSIFWWAFTSFARHRREFPCLLKEPQYAHLEVIRFADPKTATAWLDRIMVSSS